MTRAIVLALLLALPAALAGCFAPADEDLRPGSVDLLEGLVVEGAKATRLENGDLNLVWEGVIEGKSVPVVFPVPEGVTYVEATATVPAGRSLDLRVVGNSTGRLLCNTHKTASFLVDAKGRVSCSGLGVASPGEDWKAMLGASNSLSAPAPFVLSVNLSTAPLDGSAALIRWDRLSRPIHKALETETVKVPASVDGAKLHVEVTRPAIEEKVPTILVSSPYNYNARAAGNRPSDSLILAMVPRGYAVVVADVRGFGNSEGCVEVWGPKEQKDQYDLVEWVAAQPWSDGKVAFYGQSYVATTPVEAAVQRPPHLTTIAIVAPVMNTWADWHFGGVPNGENVGSPRSYQQGGTETTPEDGNPLATVAHTANGFCDVTLAARANDPRALYDAFYKERNFTARAKEINVPVFYTQGFWDENVKGEMIVGFFDALDVPKRAFYGPWHHQHAVRADMELTLRAWFDHWLKGIETGVMDGPLVEVRTPQGLAREAESWPPAHATPRAFHLASGKLQDASGAGESTYLAFPAKTVLANLLPMAPTPTAVRFASEPLAEPLYVSGKGVFRFNAKLAGADNSYFAAYLRDVAPDGTSTLLTFGWLNAAHRFGHERYEPVPPNAPVAYALSLLPADHVVLAGHKLVLEVRSADLADWSQAGGATEPGLVTLDHARSALELPTLPLESLAPAPRSAA
ncbi:MAG TPA: CocE/NonD family hydrolase [Candidatus Thermoplasmatota archaeon]|nr:CocE/NonD family hydrolase [Candidatus Thermoplasmatota archaeon]